MASYKKQSVHIYSLLSDSSSLSLNTSDFSFSPKDPKNKPKNESDDWSNSQLDDQPSDNNDNNDSKSNN